MDENRSSYYDDDVEIDLIDMMFYMLKKWRGLLVAVALGAILGLAIYAVKDHQQKEVLAQSTAETETKTDETEAFDESKYNIDEDVKANMELAYQYRQMYRKQLEYNQKSVIMQLDPNVIYTGELKYYLSAGYDTGLVSVLYQSILSDKDLLTELKTASGLDCDVPYMKELINSDISNDNNSSVNINNLLADITDSVASVTRNAFVTYRVVSTSEESCRQMLEVIREKAQQLGEECASNYDEFQAIEVSGAVRKVTDNSYLNLQKSNVDQLNTYLSNVQKLESALTDEEKEYYCQKYLAREIVAQQEDLEEIASSEIETVEPVSKGKWLAVGISLGIFVWGIWYALIYLMNSNIKTVSEAQKLSRLPLIGRYQVLSEKKGIDRFLQHLHLKAAGAGDSVSYIESVLESLNSGDVMLSGNLKSQEECTMVETLKEECPQLYSGEYLCKSVESLKLAKKVGKEILIISTNKMKRADVERELEICIMQGIQINGIIVVEQF